uniref:uncharacterized protein LOC120332179 n=1 Tax=Styela clava TaxID=7725 RepID=UPI001939D114|nr:uncharacterized protein LOC120332179 [Styela clava]
MAEREGQSPVINVQLPAINVHYGEETRFAGDNVGQKTDGNAAKIRQVVVPTPGNSKATQSNTLQHTSDPTNVVKESEEGKVKKSSMLFVKDTKPTLASSDVKESEEKKVENSPMGFEEDSSPTSGSSPSDVTQSFDSMDLSGGMMDFFAFENSRHLMQNSQFTKAVDLMEDLSPSPCQQLMMSECYFQLGRERNALRCVGALQTMMTSSPRPKVGDVIRLVDNYISDSSHIRALIFLSCCAKLCKFNPNPNDSVAGIRDCAFECSDVIKAMAQEGDKMKAIATDVGLEMITDMLRELRSVSGADKDRKAKMEARCLNDVGRSYNNVGKFKDAIEVYNTAIDLMEKTFSSNPAKYTVFGDLLNNIGLVHHYLGDYPKAESFYSQSLDAYEKAENRPSDEVKQERAKNNLKITRDKMKK